MHTTIDEINDGIYRISTWVPDVSPDGFTFNQFLVTGDEPLLFHTGPRGMFPLVAEAVAKVVPVESLRWITLRPRRGRRVRGDEHVAGGRARTARSRYGALGCDVSLNDLCDRPPRALGRRRGDRHRRQAAAPDLHPARAPRLGGPGAVRGDDAARCSAATCSRQVGRRPGADHATTSSSRRSPPRRCSTPAAWRPTRRDAAIARRPAPDDAGDHARPVVQRRRPRRSTTSPTAYEQFAVVAA